jgi:hypothetical protein
MQSVTNSQNNLDGIFLCVEKESRLLDWVIALRLAKSEKMFVDSPSLSVKYQNEMSLVEDNIPNKPKSKLSKKKTDRKYIDGSYIPSHSKPRVKAKPLIDISEFKNL